MDEIRGYIQVVVFTNPENNYCVAKLKIDDGQDNKIVIVGYFKPPQKYELYRYHGQYLVHARYGQQFEVKSYERINPTDKEGIVRFLSSSKFPGIGVAKAEELFECFGPDTLSLIQEDSSILNSTTLSEKNKKTIVEGLSSTSYLEEAVKLFTQHGLTLRDLMKMEAIYKEEMMQRVIENPYALIDDIDGIDFGAADRLATSLGFSPTGSQRIEAAIKRSSIMACQSRGDTYTDKRSIYYFFTKLVGNLSHHLFEGAFDSLVEQSFLVVDEVRIFPYLYYQAEVGISELMLGFVYRQFEDYQTMEIDKEIENTQLRNKIIYSFDQRQAIHQVFQKGINIITGGPGTGKTTIIKAICDTYYCFAQNKKIVLCAPTGRAAKRLNEVTGYSASTIHRLLGWDLHTNKFAHNELNPVQGNFLIIDEFSMVDTELFYHLLLACQNFDRILLVGDEEQLPSVMPGDLLRDLMMIKKINYYRLSDIFRQAADSAIIQIAYRIRSREISLSDFRKDDVRLHQLDGALAKEEIITLVERFHANGYNDLDVQVIAPMYSGACGIDNLNAHLREIFNPAAQDKKELKVINRLYREGDKIIQLKNQPMDDVYNGDIGIIKEIIHKEDSLEKKDLIIASFEDNIVVYDQSIFRHITHAYAISVHKAQGSEYPVVIFPVSTEHRNMLKRKLIYTAFTRAKQSLEVVGSYVALEEGILRSQDRPRLTTITERLNNRLI